LLLLLLLPALVSLRGATTRSHGLSSPTAIKIPLSDDYLRLLGLCACQVAVDSFLV
jgi:hypothetical protein